LENQNKNFGADKTEVKQMFNSIAPDYDKLNHILTLNIDKIWRKKLLKLVATKEFSTVLDIACGTGDLSIEFLKRTKSKVTAVDISDQMIEICKMKVAKQKNSENFNSMVADVKDLPFGDNSFDLVSISFGFRNFDDHDKSIKEIIRVLNPSGRLVVMEFFKSEFISKNILFRFYMQKVMPIIGNIISGHKWAYSYLFSSIEEFMKEEEFIEFLKKNGFSNIKKKKLMFGIAYIIIAEKAKTKNT